MVTAMSETMKKHSGMVHRMDQNQDSRQDDIAFGTSDTPTHQSLHRLRMDPTFKNKLR